MVNYQNGKIYKIEPNCDHEEGEIYIGSTAKKYLSQRMDTHRSSYNQWKIGKRTLTKSFKLFEKYGLENCEIILIENYPCNIKEELLAREKYYVKSLKCMNKNMPGRTSKEYYIDNKEKIKLYYENNKEKVKEYHENNREDILAKMKTYQQKNKEKIKALKSVEYICECGKSMCISNKSKHEKTKFHLNYVKKAASTVCLRHGKKC